MKSKVKIKSYNNPKFHIITVEDGEGFKVDLAITHEELEMLYKLIKKIV